YRGLALPNSDRIRLARLHSQHDYAQAHAEAFFEIEPAGELFTVPAPSVVGEGYTRPLSNVARSLYLACLKDARVRGRSAVIQVDDVALLDYQGSELTEQNWDIDLDPAIFQFSGRNTWLIEPDDNEDLVELDAGFTLQGLNVGSFGDWMMYFLPKYIVGDLSGLLPRVPVIVPELPAPVLQCLKIMLQPGVE